MAIGNVVKVVAIQSLGSAEQAVNTFHFKSPDAIGDLDLSDCAAAVLQFYTDIRANLSTQWHLTRLVASDEGAGAVTPLETAASLAGTGDAALAPLQLAVCMSLRTAVPGRQNRGRIFLGGFMHGFTDTNGLVIESIVNDIGGAAVDNLSDVGAVSSKTLCVVSRIGAGHSTPVTLVKVGFVPDTIRRRRNKLNEGYYSFAF